ncbi:competence protein ComJ [Inquilinus limosus]|uniref:competence protein ComJ n=1 Tax=Inquilinus limosus TaxID=171674 RepID=UPI003F152E5F
MIAEFELTVSYTQIVVSVSGITPPEFDWTDEHLAQGFAWMPTIVSFGVPDHDGKCLIQVETVPRIQIDPDTLWAIRVPFDVPSVPLTIGSILDGKDVKIPEGRYSLFFEALPGNFGEGRDYAFVFRLKFFKNLSPDFKILKQGTELTTDKVLRRGL